MLRTPALLARWAMFCEVACPSGDWNACWRGREAEWSAGCSAHSATSVEQPPPVQYFLGSVRRECLDHLLILHEKRSEEHTSELQSRFDLVCRLLLEKKKKTT